MRKGDRMDMEKIYDAIKELIKEVKTSRDAHVMGVTMQGLTFHGARMIDRQVSEGTVQGDDRTELEGRIFMNVLEYYAYNMNRGYIRDELTDGMFLPVFEQGVNHYLYMLERGHFAEIRKLLKYLEEVKVDE